jgi:uncharacterized membrane protein
MANENEAKPTNDKLNGGICYVFGVLYPLLYLLSVSRERQQRFLRSHCFQCLFLFGLLVPLLYVRWRPLSILSLILIIGWIVAMIQARRGKMFRLPLLGYLADRLA